MILFDSVPISKEQTSVHTLVYILIAIDVYGTIFNFYWTVWPAENASPTSAVQIY